MPKNNTKDKEPPGKKITKDTRSKANNSRAKPALVFSDNEEDHNNKRSKQKQLENLERKSQNTTQIRSRAVKKNSEKRARRGRPPKNKVYDFSSSDDQEQDSDQVKTMEYNDGNVLVRLSVPR